MVDALIEWTKKDKVIHLIVEVKSVIDNVERLLLDYPQLRDSDLKVIWTYWYKFDGAIKDNCISKEDFMKATDPETIKRACRKCREINPDLSGSQTVTDARRRIESRLRVELKKTDEYNYRGLLERSK